RSVARPASTVSVGRTPRRKASQRRRCSECNKERGRSCNDWPHCERDQKPPERSSWRDDGRVNGGCDSQQKTSESNGQGRLPRRDGGRTAESKVRVPDMAEKYSGADHPSCEPPHETSLIWYRWIQRGRPVADHKVDHTDENHRPDPRFASR